MSEVKEKDFPHFEKLPHRGVEADMLSKETINYLANASYKLRDAIERGVFDHYPAEYKRDIIEAIAAIEPMVEALLDVIEYNNNILDGGRKFYE